MIHIHENHEVGQFNFFVVYPNKLLESLFVNQWDGDRYEEESHKFRFGAKRNDGNVITDKITIKGIPWAMLKLKLQFDHEF